MSRRFGNDEARLDLVRARTVAVVGYGNQGAAHALNLRDSGVTVRVGSRPGKSRDRASADGFQREDIDQAVRAADIIVMTVPDESMRAVFEESVKPTLRAGAVLCFAHGFAVTYRLIVPPNGAFLVSPAGPGTAVREEFLANRGVPGFIAADPSELLPLALSYAKAVGLTRAGVVETTFREETECDLFGEQVVLCGGMPELAIAAFDTLVEAGYSEDVAYTECVQQVRLLADLMARYGVAGMKERISDTAEWGSYQVGQRIVDAHVRQTMATVLAEIRSGRFADSWKLESESGKETLSTLRKAQAERLHERVFQRLTAHRETD